MMLQGGTWAVEFLSNSDERMHSQRFDLEQTKSISPAAQHTGLNTPKQTSKYCLHFWKRSQRCWDGRTKGLRFEDL
jgi:hypothetical protein